jgi:hypothetical protein
MGPLQQMFVVKSQVLMNRGPHPEWISGLDARQCSEKAVRPARPERNQRLRCPPFYLC